MADIGRVAIAPYIPTIIAQTSLDILRANIVLAKLVTRDSDVDGGSFKVGDTLSIPYPGTMVANDKTLNTGVTLQVPTATTTSVVLNKHKEASFLLEDVAKALANQDVLQRYATAAMIGIAEQIEADLFALYSTFTGSLGTSGTDITAATIRSARKLLNDNKAPKVGRSIVVSDKDEIALLSDASLQNYFAFAKPETVAEGSIGRLYGFDIYQSQLVPAIAGAPVSTKNLAFAPGAMILAMRALPEVPQGTGAVSAVVTDPISGLTVRVTMGYNINLLGTQVTVDVLYGVARLRDALGAVVLT
jgi:hypothetical protein